MSPARKSEGIVTLTEEPDMALELMLMGQSD